MCVKRDCEVKLADAVVVFLLSCNFVWALQFTCVKLVQDQVGSLPFGVQ